MKRSIKIGKRIIPLWLVVTLLLSGVVGGVLANYIWTSVIMSLEVEEPLKILSYPKKLKLYPGDTKEFNVTVKNSASQNYTVILDFSLDNTTYQDNYVTFSNETYLVIPNKQNLTAWLKVEAYAPPIDASLTIDFRRISEEEEEGEVPFFDDFNTTVLDSRWAVIDPDGGSTFDLTANPGWLRITTTSPPGRDLIGSLLNTPRIMLSGVNGDFIIETKVEAPMDENDEGGGILLWKDADNWLRLDRMSRTIGHPVEQQIFFGSKGPSYEPTLSSNLNPTYLRLVRSGDLCSGYYSSDGNVWHHVGDLTFSVDDPVDVGLHIINVYHEGTFFADFDYFRVTKVLVGEVLFFDDFDDGTADGWTVQLGNYEVIDGEYYTENDLGEKSITTVDGLTCTDCIIETKLRFRDTEVGFFSGIVFRYTDNEHHYSFHVSAEHDFAEFCIFTPEYPHYGLTLALTYNVVIDQNTDYLLKVCIQGNTFTGFLNGEIVLSATDDTYAEGQVGLRGQRSDIYFDNFTVYSLP